jgi:EAL domain-containing protein (putative c-di-GMP-specific phosphodiesterase class I)/CheY-like chemotaxis protein
VSHRRILVVDDEPLILKGLAVVLKRAGWDVRAASGATEARHLLGEGPVDAAIVDYDLGDHDGLAVLGHLRDTAPSCIRVLMTGHDDLPLVVDAVNRGQAFKVLRKPFQYPELLALLDEARSSVDALARASVQRKVEELQIGRVAVLDALAAEHLGFALQPIVEVASGAVFANEALLRPRHPSFPTPVDLLVAVELHHQVDRFGAAVLAGVVPHIEPDGPLTFVNVHPLQLGDPAALEAALQPLVPLAHRVVLEITERSRLQDLNRWEDSVATLRRLGFRLAVDDLGAGYSALAMLADLQPDFIKLDRSLLTALHESPRRQRLVQLLVRFGEATGAAVIGEGVEDADELAAAIACEVPYLQGYFLGAPVVQPVTGRPAPGGASAGACAAGEAGSRDPAAP